MDTDFQQRVLTAKVVMQYKAVLRLPVDGTIDF